MSTTQLVRQTFARRLAVAKLLLDAAAGAANGLVHGGVPGVCPRPGESWLQRVRAVLHRSSSLFYQHLAHRSCMIYNRTARTATAHYFTIRASTPNTGGPSSRANDGRFFFDKAAPLRHFESPTTRSYLLQLPLEHRRQLWHRQHGRDPTSRGVLLLHRTPGRVKNLRHALSYRSC